MQMRVANSGAPKRGNEMKWNFQQKFVKIGGWHQRRCWKTEKETACLEGAQKGPGKLVF